MLSVNNNYFLNGVSLMTIQKHIVIAAIAAQQQGRIVNYVYDYNQSRYVNVHFNSQAGSKNINMYDYGRGSYVVGTLPTIYDYGSGAYINMYVDGNKFNGYDYETGSYFNGVINGGVVNIYDFQYGRYFNFGL